jgi:hypothetical protein
VKLLAGGNPQTAKADGHAPVRAGMRRRERATGKPTSRLIDQRITLHLSRRTSHNFKSRRRFRALLAMGFELLYIQEVGQGLDYDRLP